MIWGARTRRASTAFRWAAQLSSLVALVVTLVIVLVLLRESALFFQQTSIRDFLMGTVWAPGRNVGRYGVWPLLGGSIEIMLGAAVLALPFGALNAIFLSEYASRTWKLIIGIPLDLMAGIPAVVYGYLGLFLVTPWLRIVLPSIQASNAISASIVVAMMILPLISSLLRDSLANTPRDLREGAYALGCTKWEVIVGVLFPFSRSSILAAFVLAMARAIGETMAITLAAGSTPNGSLNPLKSTETIASYILSTSEGDVSAGSVRYLSIFALGLLLFAATYSAGLLSSRLRQNSSAVNL